MIKFIKKISKAMKTIHANSEYAKFSKDSNDKEFVKVLQSATKENDAFSQQSLGYYYYRGRYVKKDLKKSLKWFERAAIQGDADSQCWLAHFYTNGEEVVQNMRKAFSWWEKAAKQGYKYGQYNVGAGYYYGCGVKKNIKKAIEWYKKAAEQGYTDAQQMLKKIYREAIVAESIIQAEKAANSNTIIDYISESCQKSAELIFGPSLANNNVVHKPILVEVE